MPMILADDRADFLLARVARRFLPADLGARVPALGLFALTLLVDLSDLATAHSSSPAQAPSWTTHSLNTCSLCHRLELCYGFGPRPAIPHLRVLTGRG